MANETDDTRAKRPDESYEQWVIRRTRAAVKAAREAPTDEYPRLLGEVSAWAWVLADELDARIEREALEAAGRIAAEALRRRAARG